MIIDAERRLPIVFAGGCDEDITGKEDVETGWDTYVKKCKELGIDELVGAYQTAFERYQTQ